MHVICSTSKTRPVLYWTGNGWSDCLTMAKRFPDMVSALCDGPAWRDRGHKADTVAKLGA